MITLPEQGAYFPVLITHKAVSTCGRSLVWVGANVGPLISIQVGIIGLYPQDKYALSGQNLLNVYKGHKKPAKHTV